MRPKIHLTFQVTIYTQLGWKVRLPEWCTRTAFERRTFFPHAVRVVHAALQCRRVRACLLALVRGSGFRS